MSTPLSGPQGPSLWTNPQLLGSLLPGFNLQALQQAMQAELDVAALPLSQLSQQLGGLQAKLAAWQTLQNDLTGLLADAQTLAGTSLYQGITAQSSNPQTVGVAVSGSGTPGTYLVAVQSLAQLEIDNSAPQASATAALGYSGSFSINGHAVTVATSDSLQTLAQKINAAGAGVTATVLPSGSQYVLNIASTQGTAISWSDPNAILQGLGVLTSTGVPAQQLQKAAPAQYTINGVAETSPTNTDATSIPGVTLSFLAPTGSTPATVTVGQDQNSVVAAFQKLASDYNALLTDLNKLAGKGGVLEGEAGVLAVGNALQQILTDVHPGLPAGYQALAQIGVTLSAPVGSPTQLSMQVAAATLQKALATNGAAVAQLMNGAGGIAQLLVQELNTLVGPSGSVGGAIRELQQQISALSNEINSPTSPINLRIAAQQQALQAEFERMLSALVLSQAQGRQIQGFLLAQYGAQALGGSGGGPGGL